MSKYEKNILPRLKDIKDWARNGTTEKDMATRLHVSYSRFRDYKKDERPEYEPLREALAEGEYQANKKVESSAFEKTQGFIKTIKKTFKVKEVYYDEKGRKCEKEHLETGDEEIYIPPDTLAIIWWLKNRMSEYWRDKVENVLSTEGSLQVFFNIPRPERNADNS